jgi:hypothetical protein
VNVLREVVFDLGTLFLFALGTLLLVLSLAEYAA